MYRNSPKLIFRVDLVGDKDLNINLILLDKYFLEHTTTKNLFIASNGYTIYRGNMFILFDVGSLHLPKQFSNKSNNSYKMSFYSDEKRYDYLKKMGKSLLEWSSSEFWSGFTEERKIKLVFKNKVWLLF